MIKTFKFRIYANKKTTNTANRWLYLCRNLYNAALEQRILAWKQNHKSISYYDQQNELPKLKKSIVEYKLVGSQVLQDVINRIDIAYKSFFTHSGFPRFKSNNRYNSFTLKNKGWKLKENYIYIYNLGVFKVKMSRPIDGIIKTVTIRKTPTNKWYACFTCDNVPENLLPKTDSVVGLDVGIKSFCVDSNGKKTENPLYMRQAESILRRKQRKLSRRKKGSNRRRKALLQVAKAHEKIFNQRNDFLHKLSNNYIKSNDNIYVEDLQVKNMIKNHHLAKSISDSSWSKFFEYLTYKAEGAGRKVIKVNPYGTTQICSQCGGKVAKTLAKRTHSCPYCGLIMNRDKNAAINILQAGKAYQTLTKEVALCVV